MEEPRQTPPRQELVHAREQIYKLAMDEGLRRLEFQNSEVDTARQRLLQVDAVVVAATTFLAGSVLGTTDRPVAFYVLAVLGTGLMASVLWITWLAIRPIKGWIFETSPQVIIQDYADASDHPPSLSSTYRNLAIYYERYAESNQVHIDLLLRNLRLVILLGGATVATWIILTWTVAN